MDTNNSQRNRNIAAILATAIGATAVVVGANGAFDLEIFSKTSNYRSVYPGNLGNALENSVFEQFCHANNSIERDAAITLRDKTITTHKYELGAEAWYSHESTSSGDRNCWTEVLNENPKHLDGYQ